MKFSRNGHFIDEVTFIPNKEDEFFNKEIIYVLYWFEFLCQIDDGVNKLVYKGT